MTIYLEREQDWRVGAIVYQVLVDRFAPSDNLNEKAHLYPAPKTLHSWDETPKHGVYLEEEALWSHEIAFWGGDLTSLQTRLPYLVDLGIDVLYLNPIHNAYTNHKYDALDYLTISPEYGSRDDITALSSALHSQGLKLVLDGVFNHMGQHSDYFVDAKNNPDSEFRQWFNFSSTYNEGYRAWENALNLPELNLEHKAVRDYIYQTPGSAVQSYLIDNKVDGWRLDVAFDLGFEYLAELTQAAHEAKPGALVVGEVWNYPDKWLEVMDGVMNFSFREIILALLRGELNVQTSAAMIDQMLSDADYEGILRSWLVLDNHDTPRLKNLLQEPWQQQLAQILQFTLPGAPNLYYGVELGMEGGTDPEMRGPMQWNKLEEDKPIHEYLWCRKLIELRKAHRALAVGDFKTVVSTSLLAFERYTDEVKDCCFILVNTSSQPMTEKLMLPDARLMNNAPFEDVLGTLDYQPRIIAGMLTVTVPSQTAIILKPIIPDNQRQYCAYKRVH